MSLINKFTSAVSKLKQRIKEETKDKSFVRRMPDFAPSKITVSRAKNNERFFYQNAGLSRIDRLYYRTLKAKGNLSKADNAIVDELLKSPRNIPYRRGVIPFQHVGNASPIQMLVGIPKSLAEAWRQAGIGIHDSQIARSK